MIEKKEKNKERVEEIQKLLNEHSSAIAGSAYSLIAISVNDVIESDPRIPNTGFQTDLFSYVMAKLELERRTMQDAACHEDRERTKAFAQAHDKDHHEKFEQVIQDAADIKKVVCS